MNSRRLPTDSAMRTHNGCVHTDDTTKLSPTSCEFVYTAPTRRDSTVSSRRRRRCVLGYSQCSTVCCPTPILLKIWGVPACTSALHCKLSAGERCLTITAFEPKLNDHNISTVNAIDRRTCHSSRPTSRPLLGSARPHWLLTGTIAALGKKSPTQAKEVKYNWNADLTGSTNRSLSCS